MRRLRQLAGALLVAGGVAAVGDAAITVAWQEPVGALRASAAQSDLGDRYAELTARFADTRRVGAQSTMLGRARTARRLEQAAAPGDPLGRLRIPKIGLDEVWTKGTGTETLKRGPGHYTGTALPGRRGTVGIAGHRSTHGAPFRHLDRLDPGDRLQVSMPYGAYEYAVERTRIVSPREAEVLRGARSDRLVLTACHPVWSARQRIVVVARLVRWPGMLREAPALRATPAVGRTLREARGALADAPPLSVSPGRPAPALPRPVLQAD